LSFFKARFIARKSVKSRLIGICCSARLSVFFCARKYHSSDDYFYNSPRKFLNIIDITQIVNFELEFCRTAAQICKALEFDFQLEKQLFYFENSLNLKNNRTFCGFAQRLQLHSSLATNSNRSLRDNRPNRLKLAKNSSRSSAFRNFERK